MGPNSLVTLSGDKLPTQPFNNEGHFRGAHLAVAFLGVCLFVLPLTICAFGPTAHFKFGLSECY